jgi:hypothetical protein
MVYFWVATAVIFVAVLLLFAGDMRRGLSRAPKDRRAGLSWEDLGPVPLGEKRYTPQGMTWVDGRIVFANCWQNTSSRVYRIDPSDMRVEAWFDMPPAAVHTSGLAYDGADLWAVDFKSNRCYQIALAPSFQQQRAEVLSSFSTGLGGTSACCLVPVHHETVLAISDFRRTCRTFFVRHEAAAVAGSMADHVVASYRNGGFSQGLEWDGRYLYEAENRLGVDVMNELDLGLLLETADSRKATRRQYAAPHRGVEDLAWDGHAMYTSDEVSFRFYRTELPA